MAFDAGRAYHIGWWLAPKLPEWLVRAAFDAAFLIEARRRTKGVRQLRANLARIQPNATDKELDRLTRGGMREYGRYYAELFLLPRFAAKHKLQDRVRAIYQSAAEHDLGNTSVVLALGHTGNWDIAGTWIAAFHWKVLAVAEKLEPESLYLEFLKFREACGLEIIPFEKGHNVFKQLLTRARQDQRIVALVGDRDLSRSGVQVQLAGEPALLAAGPAALSLEGKLPLYFVGIRSAKVTGQDGRKRWGIEIEFQGPITLPEGTPRENRVAVLTQAWVDHLTEYITRYPTSWHMLQKVFLADLDPERLARRTQRS